MKTLIMVDIQNDFCPGGNLAVPDGDQVVEVANKLGARFSKAMAVMVDEADEDSEDGEEYEEESEDDLMLDAIQRMGALPGSYGSPAKEKPDG